MVNEATAVGAAAPVRQDWRAGLDARSWPRPLLAALPPVIVALALYTRTLMPGLGVWDNAEFQAIGPVLGIAHPTGYPTYTLLAWLGSVLLQPVGEPALRANLMSALLVSGAVGLIAGTVTMLTRRIVAGAAAGLAFAVAPRAWEVALAADPHALHVFFVGLLMVMLVTWMLRRDRAPEHRESADRWLVAAAAVYGLSLGNHALTMLLAPGIAIFVFAVAPDLFRRPKVILACAAAVALTTLLVYAYLPIRSAMGPPLDYANPQHWQILGPADADGHRDVVGGFAYLVFGQQFQGTFGQIPPDAIDRFFERLGSLSVLALLAPLGAGFLLLRRPALLVMLVAWFAVTWYFSLTYINAAIERYYLGPLAVVAVLGGLGAAGLIDLALRYGPLERLAGLGGSVRRHVPEISRSALWRSSARAGAAAESRYGLHAVERFSVGLVAALVLLVPLSLSVPATLPRVDQSRNLDGRRWVESVLPKLEQDAVIVSWWSFSTTLWYAQFVEGRRQDVTVIDDRTMLDQNLGTAADVLDRYVGQRPLYLIRLEGDLPALQERFEMEPVPGVLSMWGGEVYRVTGLIGEGSLQSPRDH
jgi:hypothetical protein